MTTFYICRHGETENNRNGLLSGWVDTPLTEKGKQNAISSADILKGISFNRIVSSDLGRAISTAQMLGYNSEVEQMPELREVSYGDLANQPLAAHPRLPMYEKSAYAPPNGESLASMQKRVIAYIDTIGAESDGMNVLIVAHDGTINAVYANYSGQDIGVVDSESNNGHDFVAKFEWDNGKVISFTKI
jgi:broad specificity phosphatase PhoE